MAETARAARGKSIVCVVLAGFGSVQKTWFAVALRAALLGSELNRAAEYIQLLFRALCHRVKHQIRDSCIVILLEP